MVEFEGSSFRLTLPDDYVDGTVYTFLLPGSMPEKGKVMPHIVVQCEVVAADLELPQYLANQRTKDAAALPQLRMLSERLGKRGGNEAASWLLDWGPEKARIRQRRAYVLVRQPGPPRLFSLIATDSSVHFDESESVINAVIASFQPISVVA